MLAPLALIVVAVLYRVILGIAESGNMQALHNFAPLSAIAFCGAMYLPRRFAFVLPMGILLLSDLALNVLHYHVPFWTWQIVPHYLALALIIGLGWVVRSHPTFLRVIGGAIAGSIIFYLITNTGSWIAEPAYAKTFQGWLQALTTGLPGLPPTSSFFRHTLLSDVFFTSLFYACMHAGESDTASLPDPAKTPAK
jgi:hypothetical protein